MIYHGQNNEYIQLTELRSGSAVAFDSLLSYPLLLIWIKGEGAVIRYEGVNHTLPNDTVLCLSVFHQIEFPELETARLIKFNREFYCVLNHDTEIGCKGLLFYGAHPLPHFQIPDEEREKFETLWKMFDIEMQSKDELQLEMLQMMLKRFIILCTRIYKQQYGAARLNATDMDIVREFSFLVEHYFKTKHTVKDYAELMHKSPKTLSNIFSKLSGKSPLQIIHERKLMEARRMLRYTDKSVKEIAYELGFEDIQTFSRFFKKTELISPSEFKNSLLGNLANPSGQLT
jgi:AraC family transcriptional regulator, transcriptional activator of pobA